LFAPAWLGICMIVLVNCLVVLGGLQGVIWINAVLVPIKIVALFLVCILTINAHDALGMMNNITEPAVSVQRHWVWSGLLYVSYNMILVVAVLSTLGKSITVRKAVIGGAVGGAALGATAGVVCLAGISLYPEIINYKVPTLYMAGIIGKGFKVPIGVLIWLAIVTTAVANMHGLAARVAGPGSKRYKTIGIGVTIMAIPLSLMEFDRLVGTVYPLFGYAGLLIILLLLIAPFVIRQKS